MTRHLNTLFITTDGSYLAREGQTVLIRQKKEVKLRLPIHNIGSIICLARVGISPSLMNLCGREGVPISLCTPEGYFLARISGFTAGNVLLRREQYRRADSDEQSAAIASSMVLAKIANSRQVLMRHLRDNAGSPGETEVQSVAGSLAAILRADLRGVDLDSVRGVEGDAANRYFSVFDHLILAQKADFAFTGRNRRPPLDRVNALLSFLYAMLGHDARSACESAGLDPAVGFLHRDRPGRPGLALDLMEEFRPLMADRLVLSLVNRRQVAGSDFELSESGAVRLSDNALKRVLAAYQKRKQTEIVHPFIGEKVTVGLLLHLQALLMARHLRGDLDAYPAFVWK
ncbi:MAG: type I-C CRISPR-associated endonuclease Cas1c [Planctomycetota bacterium]|nr:type I-C CRISPR-associated endonuclease Cas1c [Planctomycetota bacterium]